MKSLSATNITTIAHNLPIATVDFFTFVKLSNSKRSSKILKHFFPHRQCRNIQATDHVELGPHWDNIAYTIYCCDGILFGHSVR